MKLALFGYGRMGRAVHEIAVERGHEVTATLDEGTNERGGGITRKALAGARVAIDFSTGESVLPNVRRACELGANVVVGTTGWDSDLGEVEAIVTESGTGLLYAPNFSIGMFLFTRLVESAARMVDRIEDYDVHLWEAHHRHKVDHPGGTARALADLLVSEIERKVGWTTDLPGGAPHDVRELQVAVSRVGEVPGIHEVGLEGPDDRIQLRHEARNRLGFARGSVLAAEWLEGRSGVFTLPDFMADLLGGPR